MQFLVYSCDCVGFEVELPEGRMAFCVHPCDVDGYSPGTVLNKRPGLLEKESTPLDPAKTLTLLERLGTLVREGNDLGELRRIQQRCGLAPRMM